MNSSYTGRAARTMREAFNPYCDDTLFPMPEPRDYPSTWYWCVGVIGVLAVAIAWVTR